MRFSIRVPPPLLTQHQLLRPFNGEAAAAEPLFDEWIGRATAGDQLSDIGIVELRDVVEAPECPKVAGLHRAAVESRRIDPPALLVPDLAEGVERVAPAGVRGALVELLG